jgi:hypothetical protein
MESSRFFIVTWNVKQEKGSLKMRLPFASRKE